MFSNVISLFGDLILSVCTRTQCQALDVEAIVSYNSFDNLAHYYSEMSAMGDREPEFGLFGAETAAADEANHGNWGRIANVSVPFAVLQALDDPLVSWRTIVRTFEIFGHYYLVLGISCSTLTEMPRVQGTNDPQALADSGKGNVILVLTKAGGHVVS